MKRIHLDRTIIYILTMILVAFAALPVTWMYLSAFRTDREVFTSPPTLIPSEISLIQYEKVFRTPDFLKYLTNSLVVALGATLIGIAAATLAGYSLARFRFRWQSRFAHFTLLLYMVPGIALVIPLFVMFTRIGLADTLFSLVLGHVTLATPFSMFFLWIYFRAMPVELEEAAMVDGLSRLGAFLHITLRLAVPGIAAAAIYSFTVSWNDYLFAFTLITSEHRKTLVLAYSMYSAVEGVDWGIVMALSTLIATPPFVALIYIKNYLLRGLGYLGTKG